MALAELNKSPTREMFAAKVSGKPNVAVKPKFKALDEEGEEGLKLLGFGNYSTGKTLALKGFLEAGMKVCGISTDVGGNGLASVKLALREAGKDELMRNLVNCDLPDYKSVEGFVKAPEDYWPEIWEWDPDLMYWDGFSGFQRVHLDIEVLEAIAPLASGDKVSEGREAGLWADRSDWGMIMRGTLKNLVRFLMLTNRKTGRKIHKYVTCLEAAKAPSSGVLTGKIERGPLIAGAAQSLMGPAFDVIFRCKIDGEGKERRFVYETATNERLMVKSRGFKLEPEEPGDMFRLWAKLMNQLQGRK